jgi:predicted dehydrogenase
VYSPRLSNSEPLSRLVAHFAAVIREGIESPVDGRAGLRIVRLLETSQKSLDANLRAVNAAEQASGVPAGDGRSSTAAV